MKIIIQALHRAGLNQRSDILKSHTVYIIQITARRHSLLLLIAEKHNIQCNPCLFLNILSHRILLDSCCHRILSGGIHENINRNLFFFIGSGLISFRLYRSCLRRRSPAVDAAASAVSTGRQTEGKNRRHNCRCHTFTAFS